MFVDDVCSSLVEEAQELVRDIVESEPTEQAKQLGSKEGDPCNQLRVPADSLYLPTWLDLSPSSQTTGSSSESSNLA